MKKKMYFHERQMIEKRKKNILRMISLDMKKELIEKIVEKVLKVNIVKKMKQHMRKNILKMKNELR